MTSFIVLIAILAIILAVIVIKDAKNDDTDNESSLNNAQNDVEIIESKEKKRESSGYCPPKPLKGSSWFQTIAFLSILNIVLSYFDYSFIFAFGISQLLQIAIANNTIDPVYAGLCILGLPLFFFWTYKLSAVRGYRLCYNIGWTIYMVDLLLLIYLFSLNPEALNVLLIDVVLHVIVLFACFKIFAVNLSRDKVQNFPWNIDKICYLVTAVSMIILMVYSVLCISNQHPATNKEILTRLVEMTNKELPKAIEEGVVFQQIIENDKSIEYLYQLKDVYLSESDTGYLSECAKVQRHEMLHKICVDSIFNKFVAMCLSEEYTLIYRHNDATSEKLYEVKITPSEYGMVLNQGSYKCPISEISDLIRKYNSNLPSEYIGGFTLQNIHLSSNDTALVYKVKLPKLTFDEFCSITPSYLHEYLKYNFSDIMDSMIRLAIINQMTIIFDISTSLGEHYTKIDITPEYYNNIRK